MGITEFASLIGLSISTVSRALNGYSDVKPETREFVRQSAIRLGYTPNAASRRLRSKKKLETVGFLAPRHDRQFLNPVLLETLSGLDLALAEKGVNLSVLSLHSARDEVAEVRSLVGASAVDALILSRTRRFDERIRYLSGIGFPFLCFGQTEVVSDYRFVDIEHRSAARQSVAHLCALGHERIALINGPEEFMLHFERRLGFEDAIRSAGLAPEPALMVETEVNPKAGTAAATELLQRANRPTAIVCASDYIAYGVFAAARELGIAIGTGLSVIGCDDLPSSEFLTPALTTVSADRYHAGRALASLLLAAASDAEAGISVPMTMTVRGSTGPRQAAER